MQTAPGSMPLPRIGGQSPAATAATACTATAQAALRASRGPWLVLAVAMAMGLAAPAGRAQSFDPPTYGTVTLGPDMGARIDSYAIEAGGQDPATALSWECTGNLNAAAPDLVVRLDAPASRLSIFATAPEDLTLVVRRPSGAFLCNDDTQGLHPAVVLLKPAQGDYAVWLGNFGTDLVAAELHLSQAPPDWAQVDGAMGGQPGAPATPAPSAQAPDLAGGLPLRLLPTPEPEAARLGQAVIDALDTLAAQLAAGGAMAAAFSTETPVIAQTDGAGVAVTLPGLELRLDDVRLRFGTPRVEVTALADGAQRWQATLDPAIEVIAQGRAQGALVWSDSRLAGRLDPQVGLMTDLDALWSDLAWQPRDPAETLLLGARTLAVTSQLRPAGEGLFSGPVTLRLSDLELADVDGTLRLGMVQLGSEVTGYDPAMGRAVDDLTRALAEGRDPAALIATLVQGRWGAGQNALTLEDLVFDSTDGSGIGLGLRRLHLAAGIDGRGPLGSLHLSWSAEAAEVRQPDWPAALNPAGAALALRLDNLPLRQLLELAAQVDPQAEDALALVGLQALGMVMAASPSLRIETLGLSGGEAALTGSGAFGLRDGFAGEGALDLRIAGIDGLIALASSGDFGEAAGREAVPVLIALRGLGTRDPAGGADLLYRVELTPELGVLINGLDMRQFAP